MLDTARKITMKKIIVLYFLGGLVLSGCVATQPTSRVKSQHLNQPIQDAFYTDWAKGIQQGMNVNALIHEKGKADVVRYESDNAEVFYYWHEHEHIPVYLKNNLVTGLGVPNRN